MNIVNNQKELDEYIIYLNKLNIFYDSQGRWLKDIVVLNTFKFEIVRDIIIISKL